MDLARRRRQRGGPLARFRDEMDDLFGRFFGDVGDWPAPLMRAGTWFPAIDVAEREDAVVVKAELPGLKSDDIEISVQGNMLTIAGEKKEEEEEKEENYYHAERRYGSFRRDIPLPSGADADKVEATFKDGVLVVTVPKTEEAQPKKVEVKS
jgi:HSP20 family protein